MYLLCICLYLANKVLLLLKGVLTGGYDSVCRHFAVMSSENITIYKYAVNGVMWYTATPVRAVSLNPMTRFHDILLILVDDLCVPNRARHIGVDWMLCIALHYNGPLCDRALYKYP